MCHRASGAASTSTRTPSSSSASWTSSRKRRARTGSFVYGLSALFFQECTVKDGHIEQTNFHDYNSMRIAQMPKVETVLLPTGGEVWGGIGEPTICIAAPAVLNAFYRATGKRLRTVPLKNHGIELV